VSKELNLVQKKQESNYQNYFMQWIFPFGKMASGNRLGSTTRYALRTFGANAAPKLAYSFEPFCRQEPVCPRGFYLKANFCRFAKGFFDLYSR
jgi:hypothetical protein